MHKATIWEDRVLDAETGEVVQEGTDQSAGNFNNMEYSISDAHVAAALTMIATYQRTE